MSLHKSKPTSAGRRFQVAVKTPGLHKGKPFSALLDKKTKNGGRNNNGRITVRHQGGGHKQRYRIIYFKRDKFDVPAKVATIEYDPNRSAQIALLHYADGEKRYILAPVGIKVDDMLESGPGAEIRPGNALPLRNIPTGTLVHGVELRPGGGAKMGRSAGTAIQLMSKENKVALLRLPSGEMRQVSLDARATIGQVGNTEAELVKIGKAGRNRWKGKRPQSRGVAMNPVDHPLGGGEGRSSGGRHPVSPWGKPEKRTRKKNKASDKNIVRRRNTKGKR